MAAIPTTITVRVIAKGGKFLGDDIGGAQVTIRDAQTGELLASGTTQGGSGNTAEIMQTCRERGIGLPPVGQQSVRHAVDRSRKRSHRRRWPAAGNTRASRTGPIAPDTP